MTVDMYMLIPIDRPDLAEPQLDDDLQQLVKALNAKDEKKEEKKEEEDDNNTNFRRRGRYDNQNPKYTEALQSLHKGWVDVLAWSHGFGAYSRRGRQANDSGIQDLSVTKYVDSVSPILNILCVTKEVLPFITLRCFAQYKEGESFWVQEITFKYSKVTSVSTGGSGGEDRLTENISVGGKIINVQNYKINAITGEKIPSEGSFGNYDLVKKKGNRTKFSDSVPSLLSLTKQKITGLSTEEKQKLEKSDIISEYDDVVEEDDDTFLITTDLQSQMYKRIFIKDAKKETLWNEIAKKLEKPTSAIKSVFVQLNEKAYEEISTDKDVKFLSENDNKFLLVKLNE